MLRTLTLTSLALVALTLHAVTPRRAAACSAPDSSVSLFVLPADGAVDVPRNAVVTLSFSSETGDPWCDVGACDPDTLRDVVLTTEAGDLVPTTLEDHMTDFVAWLRLVPDAPLPASTRFQIWSRLSPRPCESTCLSPDRVVIATFETGTRVDDTPPTFAGLGPLGETPYSGAGDAACGFFSGIGFQLFWEPATDEATVAYRIETSTGSAAIVLPGEPTPRGYVGCAGSPMVSLGVLQGSGPFHVTAIDLAGNEDDNTAMASVVSECFPIPYDGGTPMGPDGGPASTDAGARTDGGAARDGGSGPDAGASAGGSMDGCGCATAGARPRASLLALVAAIAPISVVVRRARTRTGRARSRSPAAERRRAKESDRSATSGARRD